MEWLQDQLLRLAARYYCQDIDVDASKLQIEKWDSESCKIKAKAKPKKVRCETLIIFDAKRYSYDTYP